MYVIIDLETTGGKPHEEAITEIAIYKYDGNELVDQFISMVNPERPIQPFVQRLTGINNKMLRNAPKFYEIAKRVVEITDGCTLVAHNASFDYRVLKKEFDRLGYDYSRPRLCTVKLSKELIPGLQSYSLGKLCKSLHIPMSDRHRASGDALATLELFKLILNKKRDLSDRLEHDHPPAKRTKLSDDLIQMIDELPPKKGILYLYDEKDKLISVENTRNIKKKINSIFLKNNPKSLDLQKQLKKIDYELLSGSLINKIITWHYRHKYNPRFSVCTRRKYSFDKNFEPASFLLIDHGHHPGEKAVIFVENHKVQGYGFFKLNWEQESIDLIKKRLTPVENHPFLRKMIQEHIEKKKYVDLVELDE